MLSPLFTHRAARRGEAPGDDSTEQGCAGQGEEGGGEAGHVNEYAGERGGERADGNAHTPHQANRRAAASAGRQLGGIDQRDRRREAGGELHCKRARHQRGDLRGADERREVAARRGEQDDGDRQRQAGPDQQVAAPETVRDRAAERLGRRPRRSGLSP